VNQANGAGDANRAAPFLAGLVGFVVQQSPLSRQAVLRPLLFAVD
jgi:hypothetical protein